MLLIATLRWLRQRLPNLHALEGARSAAAALVALVCVSEVTSDLHAPTRSAQTIALVMVLAARELASVTPIGWGGNVR